MYTTCTVHSEEVKTKIDLSSVERKPYLGKTHSEKSLALFKVAAKNSFGKKNYTCGV